MFESERKTTVTLPDDLRRQFDAVARRLWEVETTAAVACGAGALGVSLLALFISDRFWDTPVWARATLFALGLIGLAAAALAWCQRWVWRRRDLRALARLVQSRHRRLGDRLLGIVELANEQQHDANFSPALYHAAIRQVAQEASQFDFRLSVDPAPAQRAGSAFAAVAVILGAALAAVPAAYFNSFERWAAPWAGIPRYTLMRLEGLPPQMTVPHGEAFEVSGQVNYRSFWKPRRVVGMFPGQAKLEGNVAEGRVRLPVTGQVEKGVLRVRLGDAEALVRVEPVHRPALQDLRAEVALPEYLHYTNETESIQDGALTMVEGSSVTFRGRVSRELSAASMLIGGETNAELRVEGGNFASRPTAPSGMAEIIFNWRDVLGLSNATPLRVAAVALKDAPPVVDMPDMPHEMAMLESDSLRIEVQASDDYGVRDLGLSWEVESDQPLAGSTTTEMKNMMEAPNLKKAAHVFRWSPALLRIPAGTAVELEGFARDYYPQRARSRTQAHRLRVLSAEEHAELVRQQLEATLAQLEDVTRLQEKIATSAEDAHAGTNMPDAQKTARMGQAKDDQLQNAAQLKALSEQGERAVQEAMKNPIFKENTIQQWNAQMQQWQKLSQQQMPDAAQSMQAAQQNSKTRDQDMADAEKKAEDILAALQKMQAKANEHMDDLQALTLAQRLRKVGSQEKEIGGKLLGTAADTIGLPPQDLPSKYKRLEFDLAKDEGHSQEETAKLQSEIGRFFERTKKASYGEVTKEMKESHVTDDLDRLTGLIGNNIAMDASSSLTQWSDRFDSWGDKLEPKDSSSSGQSGSQSGKKNEAKDLTKQLIALLRLREQQLNVRDDAGLLEQNKGDAKEYAEQAKRLSERQQKIGDVLEQVHKDTDLPALDPAFGDAADSVRAAQGFLDKPETDEPSDNAQVKTIDSLTDLVNLINEQSQKPKPQPSQGQSESSAEQMAFLMQAMKKSSQGKGMAMKPATGLNQNGGTTDRAGTSIDGDVNGKSGPGRGAQKASGAAQNAPTEFREALDNYFHGIEQK
jgi:hypothetical protein